MSHRPAPETVEIATASDLPSDGMITIKPWDRTRRRGWHIEKITSDFGEGAFAMASPVNIAAGTISGDPQKIHLRFGLDTIEAMP